tara:strand:- start:106522 stop:106788 length:267 start_codon:yes stop_codon:yes gene_type:complete
MKKPNTSTAMKMLIEQIQTALPFEKSEHEICAGKCVGCAKKMLEYMGSELDHYQCQLNNEETPTLGEISNLANIAKKVHRNMVRNSLV